MKISSQLVPVAVIVPCYKCSETVRQALDSILRQTIQPAEILLIDDASGDGTLDVLRKLEAEHVSRVKVVALPLNGGPGLARNAGWEAATQPWLAFLDADDAWHPRKLEIQWAWLAAHPEVILCGHDSQFSTGRIDHSVDATPSATRLTLAKMLVSNRLPTRSVMLRRDLPFRFRGKDVTEDYLLWLQVIASGQPATRLEVCLAYSLRPDFSPGGYSGQLWTHEKRELAALRTLRFEGYLSWFAWIASSAWSVVKFLRRRWLMRGGEMSERRPRMCMVAATPLTIHFFFKPHLRELARFFEVTLACHLLSDPYLPPLSLPVRELAVPMERNISPCRDLLALFSLCRLFGRARFDIVVSVVPKAGLLGMLAAWLLRVPHRVHIFQGEVWASRRGPMRWMLRWMDGLTARLATHVLVVSASERNFLEREGVVPMGKAQLLGAGSICGVDTGKFRADPATRTRVRAELGIPERAVLCVFLGRLTADKGVLELAQAFALSAATQSNLWLLLAGPDEEQMERHLRALVPEQFNLRMVISGFTQTPEEVLAASDFLCLPSHREGFGMVILEAASVGIPSIGTQIHGITDAIEDGITGRLVSVGDIEALAKAINCWCECPQERSRCAAAARNRVISTFEQQSVVNGYVEYFRNLLCKRAH